MPIPSRRHLCFSLIAVALIVLSVHPPPASADELSVISHPAKLQLPLGQHVDSSPGSRPGSITTCNRVRVVGLSRLRDPAKYAHALKVRVSVPQGDALFRLQAIEVCFHRNASLGIGMCPASQWQKLTKGSWVQPMSSYGHMILDIRMLPDPSRFIELSTEFDFLVHRLVFLVVGMITMTMAHSISESVTFYYGSAMAVGIILVILMVLFQGMRLLPTGRKSSLAIFLYSSVVGAATFLLHYLSGLLRSALVQLGISEDMHNPLGIFLLVSLVLTGAWFGYWSVHKLVLTEEGLVDSSVSYFVEWSILILSAVIILQSSLDTLLAVEAFVFSIILSSIARTHGKMRFLRRLFKGVIKCVTFRRTRSLPSEYIGKHSRGENPYRSKKRGSSASTPPQAKQFQISPPYNSPPIQGSSTIEKGSYYSTFHNTPQRRFTKEEWNVFTREETKAGLRELVASPDFNRWAVDNAERIMVTPPDDDRRNQNRRTFHWF